MSRAGRTAGARRRAGLVALVVAALFGASAAGLAAAGAAVRDGSAPAATPQPYAGQCPGGAGQCVAVSLPCSGPASTCPTVVVGATENLVTGQYVALAMSNFPVGDTVRVAYCSTDGAGTIVPDPYCGSTTSGGITLGQQIVTVTGSGTSATTMPVDFDPDTSGNVPLPSTKLVYDGSPASTFFCDNGPDYCSLVVTDEGQDSGVLDTTDNTVIVPLQFAPGSLACPAGDPTVYTDGAFSVEHLIPAMVQATCDKSGGVVALDTATDTAALTEDLANGGTQLAFTDDASDPQLNAELAANPKVAFHYIPVALSATVVGFRAGVQDLNERTVIYPLDQYDMTPNMVAGMLTTAYEGGGTNDSLIPPLVCADIVGCKRSTEIDYNTFYMTNPEPDGIGQPNSVGSFFSNTSSGASYQLSDWMCTAPNAPFDVTVDLKEGGPTTLPVVDPTTAAETLTTPPTLSPFWDPDTPPSLWPFKSCTPTSQFPTLSPGSLSQYQPADTPGLQAKSIRAYGSAATLAVGAMDWSEASFNGLNAASLQNAAGDFVAPSSASIDAALAEATENANGTYSFAYTDAKNPDVYPMPMITYAVVPDTPLPAAQAHAISDLLTNVVAFDAGKDGPLPGGYVPLTPALVTQATKEIAADVVVQPSPAAKKPTAPSKGSTTTTTTASQTSTTTGSSAAGSSGPSEGLGTSAPSSFSTAPAASTTTTVPAARRHRGARPAAAATPQSLAGFDVATSGSRLVLPVLVGATALALATGVLLLALPPRRRRAGAPTGGGEASPPGDGGP